MPSPVASGQTSFADLDRDGIGEPVHRELFVVARVEHEHVDLVVLDQAAVVRELVTQADLRLHRHRSLVLGQSFAHGFDVVARLLEQSPVDAFTRVVGVDGGDPPDPAHVPLEYVFILDVAERERAAVLGHRHRPVHEAVVEFEVLATKGRGERLTQVTAARQTELPLPAP